MKSKKSILKKGILFKKNIVILFDFQLNICHNFIVIVFVVLCSRFEYIATARTTKLYYSYYFVIILCIRNKYLYKIF